MTHTQFPPSDKIMLEQRADGHSLVAAQRLSPGDVVLRLGGWALSRPSRYSVQIDEHVHLEGFSESVQNYMNHNCNPSCRIDWTSLSVVALRPIDPGEEVTFHYCTSEWDMKEPFSCACGSATCLGTIRGARYLGAEEVAPIFPHLSPFLRRKILGSRQHRRGGIVFEGSAMRAGFSTGSVIK